MAVQEQWATFLSEGNTTTLLAATAGFACDRLGFAFACGYQAALHDLWPGPGWASFCVTEAGGGHPKAIQTRIMETVTGQKSFATLAPWAQRLFVVGWSEQGLRVAEVDARGPGVTIEALPELPFAPEIPHARVVLAQAPIQSLLPGDGYDLYLKPFRTVEDIHVMAATAGYLLRIGQNWPEEIREDLLAILAGLLSLSSFSSNDPGVHLALDSLFRQLIPFFEPSRLELLNATDRHLLERDQALLLVAGRVRAQRRKRAWESVR